MIPPNPFPGLRPFLTEEDYLFFGREEQTSELLALLREHRFLAVVGASGSGKSSLVRAGLIPALHRGAMTRAGSAWEVAVLRPGGNPVRNLARAFCDADLYDTGDPETLPRLQATLRHSRMGLVEACRQSGIEEGANLLVVIDQFEELFRFEQHDVESCDEANAFVNLILAASRATECPVYIVVTMRSDYLGDCSRFQGLAEAVNEGEYLIPRLGRAELRSAIDGPVKVGEGAIANRLVLRLLNDVGDDPDQLPVLQHALMRTWERWTGDHGDGEPLDLRHYEAVGGLHEALSRHADEVWESLPDDLHRETARRVFKTLTEKGADNRGIRRPTRLDRLERVVGAEHGVVTAVVEAYRRPGVTFIMPSRPRELADRTVIDLSHESLMRVWRRLRGWVEEEAQSARIFRRLAETAALRKEGRAGLYHDPDLQIAQSWVRESRPNAAWAEQYGGGFAEAVAFLETSREAAEAEERAREAARQRELEQARTLAATQAAAARNFKRFSVGMGIVALVALAAMIFAVAARREVSRTLGRSDLIRGTELIERSDSIGGLGLLLRSHRLDPSTDAPLQSAFGVLTRRPVPMPALEITAGDADITSTAVHGDTLAVGDAEGKVRIHELTTGRVLVELEQTPSAPVEALAFSDDGDLLAAGIEGGFVELWEWREETDIWRADLPYMPRFSRLELAGPDSLFLAEIQYSDARWFVVQLPDRSRLRWFQLVRENAEGFSPLILMPGGSHVVAQSSAGEVGRLALDFRSGLERLYPRANGSDGDDEEDGGGAGAVAPLTAFDVSPDGAWLAVAIDGGGVVLERLDVAAEAVPLAQSAARTVDLRFSRDGRRLVASAADGTARLFAVRERIELARLAHPVPLREAWFSPDGGLVLTVSVDSRARLWSAETGEPLVEPFPHLGPYGTDPFVAGGPWILVRQSGNRLRLLRTRSVPQLPLALWHGGSVNDAAFSADGALVAAACEDGSVSVWRAADGALQARLEHGSAVLSAAFSGDGRRLLTVDRAGVARVWAAGEWRETAHIDQTPPVLEAVLSPDGESVLTRHAYGMARLWEGATGKARSPRLRHAVEVRSVALGPDGGLVAAATETGEVTVWDPETARVFSRAGEATEAVSVVRFHPDGDRLATVTAGGALRVSSIRSGAASIEIAREVIDCAWTPDGRAVLAVGGDHSVRLRDPENGEILGSIDHAGRVTAAALDASGRRLLAIGGNGARVWDPVSGQPLTPPLEHDDVMTAARFDADGRRVLTASVDGALRVWETGYAASGASSRELVALADAVVRDQGGDRDGSGTAGGPALDDLRQSALDSPAETAGGLGRWFFAAPGEQTLSPGCPVSLSSHLERAFERRDLDGLRWSVLLDPDDALQRARLALLRLSRSATAASRFHSRLDLERAIAGAPDDPEVWFLRAPSLDLAGDGQEARRSYERAGELGEPELAALVARIDLIASVGAAGLPASRAAMRSLLDRAIERAAESGSDGARFLLDLRARRLELLAQDGEFREAREDWEHVRSASSLAARRLEELFRLYLDAARTEFDAAAPAERRERAVEYLAAFLLRWLAPIYRGDLSEKWTYRERLRGLPETEAPRTPLIARKSEWRYLDDGADPGSEWRELSFDDSAWKRGSGVLGFGDPRDTQLEPADGEGNRIITYYFRRVFELEADLRLPDLLVEMLCDDGLVLYIDGEEVLRYNLPPGPVTPETRAESTVGGDDEHRYSVQSRPARRLGAGSHVVAVEVHQTGPGSTDLGFDLELDLGLAASRYLDGVLSDERGEEVIRAMESMAPGTDGGELGRTARIVFSSAPEAKPVQGSARAWLARAHVLHSLWRLDEGLEAAERAVALAGAEAAEDPARISLAGECWHARERLLGALGRSDDSDPGFRERLLAGPPRDPSLSPSLLDLGAFYNASRYDGRLWHSAEATERLEGLPEVVTAFSGVAYDARGIIQLNSGIYPADTAGGIAGTDVNGLFGGDYPDKVTIPIGRAAKTVCFLGSTIYGRAGEGTAAAAERGAGRAVARYVVRYADGSTVEEPVIWGADVVDWYAPGPLEDLRALAWVASDGRTTLQEKIWRNPHPEKVISEVDFVSERIEAAPFLMAITLRDE